MNYIRLISKILFELVNIPEFRGHQLLLSPPPPATPSKNKSKNIHLKTEATSWFSNHRL